MARGGYKFFDTDAHVGPYVDVLEPYLTEDDKSRLAAWEQPSPAEVPDRARRFETLWSFEPEVVRAANIKPE